MDNLTVIVLAAGGGVRMEPLGADISKVMIPILGQPILAYVLNNIKEAGAKKVIIVVLERTAKQIVKYFKRNWKGLAIDYVYIKETFGPSYALNEVKQHIKTPYFLVQYGDSISDENITKKVLNTFKKNPKVDGILATREVDDPSRYGVVRYKGGKIVEIVEKPGFEKAPSHHAAVGTFILKTDLFKKGVLGEKFTGENQLFPAQYLLRNGAKMSSYFFRGERVDVGKPEDLFKASQLFAKTPVKCIIFDADNTLYNTREVAKIGDLAAMEVLSKTAEKTSAQLYKNWQEIITSVVSSKNPNVRNRLYSYEKLCQNQNQPKEIAEKMFDAFTSSLLKKLKPTEGLIEILKSLPQDKYIFTEDTSELIEKKLKHLKLNKYFKDVISSDKVGVMKPSKKYFEELLKEYKPQEILVVGDNWEKDLRISAELGMQVMFITNEKDLKNLEKLTQDSSKHIHIMGIAGAGAAAVAGISKAYGYKVTGCDIEPQSSYTKNLKIKIIKGHSKSHLKNVDLLIASPAVEKLNPDNSEIKEAQKIKTTVMSWQEFQGKYLQKNKFVITVAGAYGKSTTTAMIAKILADAGFDPTCEIGAKIVEWQNNFRVGNSKYYVCESDEYNNNFLNYHPDVAVILNVGWDHPDFFKTHEEVIKSYKKFINNIKPNGLLIIPQDLKNGHPELFSKIRPHITVQTVKDFGKYNLKIIGDFRKINADAAITVAESLNIDTGSAKKYVNNFQGVGRRLEIKGEIDGVMFYDDYAVQPYTVLKTSNALKEKFPNDKVTLVFEPHTFSRINTFFVDFVNSLKLSKVDEILVTELFAAREKGDRKDLSEKLVRAVGKGAKFTGSIEQTAAHIRKNLRNFKIVCSMGAGDSYKIFDLVKKEWITKS